MYLNIVSLQYTLLNMPYIHQMSMEFFKRKDTVKHEKEFARILTSLIYGDEGCFVQTSVEMKNWYGMSVKFFALYTLPNINTNINVDKDNKTIFSFQSQ